MPHTVLQILRALQLLACEGAPPESCTDQIRRAFLDFGSETPDNVSVPAAIELAMHGLRDRPDELALTVNPSGCALDQIAYALEYLDLPAALNDKLPEVTQADWDAFTRFTTLLYLALRRPVDGTQTE